MISKNPYSESIIEEYNPYDKDKTIELINSAQESFMEWKNFKLEKRLEIIEKIKSNLVLKKMDCAYKITQEMGKPITESITEIEK